LLYGTALALLVPAALQRTDAPASTALFGVVSTVAFALVVAALVFRGERTAERSLLGRDLLGSGFLAWTGLISYSVYLWHEPVLLFLDDHLHLDHRQAYFPLTTALLLVTSIPIAWLSYQLVERTFARFRLVLRSDGRFRDIYAES
jgi:peptidoglycan/LPS O-acetylase OafA/YrhL